MIKNRYLNHRKMFIPITVVLKIIIFLQIKNTIKKEAIKFMLFVISIKPGQFWVCLGQKNIYRKSVWSR